MRIRYHSYLHVRHRGSLLRDRHPPYKVRIGRQQVPADVEILYCASRLDSIQRLLRNLLLPQEVALNAEIIFVHLDLILVFFVVYQTFKMYFPIFTSSKDTKKKQMYNNC